MLRLRLNLASGAPRLALACLGVLVLAGCGVKGPLEPPPGAHVAAPAPQAPPPAETNASASTIYSPTSANEMANSLSPQPKWEANSHPKGSSNPLQGAQRPDQPFILDGLL